MTRAVATRSSHRLPDTPTTKALRERDDARPPIADERYAARPLDPLYAEVDRNMGLRH